MPTVAVQFSGRSYWVYADGRLVATWDSQAQAEAYAEALRVGDVEGFYEAWGDDYE